MFGIGGIPKTPTSDRFFVSPEADGVEPLALTIKQTEKATSESRSRVYNLIGEGVYEAVKSGRRTLVIFESIKRRFASLPRANIKAPPPRPPRAITEEPRPRRGWNPKQATKAASASHQIRSRKGSPGEYNPNTEEPPFST